MSDDNFISQMAIDLYDALKEITKLKAENNSYRTRVCSMCDGHGLVGNMLDSMDCPDCVALINDIKAGAAIELAGIFHDGEYRIGRAMLICEDYAKKLKE